MSFQDHLGRLELTLLRMIQILILFLKTHRKIAGVDLDYAMQAQVANQLQVARPHAAKDERSRGLQRARFQGSAGKDAQEGAVHSGTIVKIDDKGSFARRGQAFKEISDGRGIEQIGLTVNFDDNGIGISIHQEYRLFRFGHWIRPSRSSPQEVAQHVGQDPAISIVIHFNRSIDPHQNFDYLLRTVGTFNQHFNLLARLETVVQSRQ